MSNTPNYQGIFLRGYGSQSYSQNNGTNIGFTTTTYSSGLLGSIQGDAVRDTFGNGSITTTATNINNQFSNPNSATGVFSYTSGYGYRVGGDKEYDGGALVINFNFSATVPTANEIRPVNMAVRYLIKAK